MQASSPRPASKNGFGVAFPAEEDLADEQQYCVRCSLTKSKIVSIGGGGETRPQFLSSGHR